MFKGRIRRLAYFLGGLYTVVPLLVLIALTYVLSSTHSSGLNAIVLLLSVVWVIFSIVIGIGLSVRRWHDLNQSGWLTLLQYVPLANIVCGLIQLFGPGTVGPNSYGDQPDSSLAFKSVLFGSGSSGAPAGPAPATGQPVPPSPNQTPSSPPTPPPPVQPQPVQPTPPVPPPAPATPPPAEQAGSDQPPTQ